MSKIAFSVLMLTFLADASADAANLLINPSFEAGRTPWFSLVSPDKIYWNDFAIVPDPSNLESRCARLSLTSDHAPHAIGIWGAIQEVEGAKCIPRNLRGRYLVENWHRGTLKQYIQVVLIVWTTRDYLGLTERIVPVQLAFVLGGIVEPPFEIGNRKFVFAGPAEPETGAWRDFDFDLHAAFATHWGFLPDEFRSLRILYEVRYDNRQDDEDQARATVYFDDLYLGDDAK